MRTQAASQEHTRELSELQAREAAAQARAERLAEENNGLVSRSRADNDIMRAIAPLGRHLEAMEHRVQVMQETQAAQRAELHEQLEANGRGQRELAQETSSLRSVLISTSARGTWGEVELRRVVEAAGMLAHVDFSEQMSTGAVTNSASASRPDLTIHLPGGAHIAVDAKVPLSAILRAQDISGEGAREQAERERLLKEHAKALRAHITTLAKRNYPAEFPGSPQITVMFLPQSRCCHRHWQRTGHYWRIPWLLASPLPRRPPCSHYCDPLLPSGPPHVSRRNHRPLWNLAARW
jgi:DNA recombination protein RmuC